jgi:catalase
LAFALNANRKGNRLTSRRNKIAKDQKTLTAAFCIPVADDQNSMTAGESGPVLWQDA